jgi:hypothetical protein
VLFGLALHRRALRGVRIEGIVLMRIPGNQNPLIDCVWQKYRPLIPVRTVEGTLRYSEIWRRWTGQFWEYSERPDSRGEWTGEPRGPIRAPFLYIEQVCSNLERFPPARVGLTTHRTASLENNRCCLGLLYLIPQRI